MYMFSNIYVSDLPNNRSFLISFFSTFYEPLGQLVNIQVSGAQIYPTSAIAVGVQAPSQRFSGSLLSRDF